MIAVFYGLFVEMFGGVVLVRVVVAGRWRLLDGTAARQTSPSTAGGKGAACWPKHDPCIGPRSRPSGPQRPQFPNLQSSTSSRPLFRCAEFWYSKQRFEAHFPDTRIIHVTRHIPHRYVPQNYSSTGHPLPSSPASAPPSPPPKITSYHIPPPKSTPDNGEIRTDALSDHGTLPDPIAR